MATAPERAADYHRDTEQRLSSSIARPLIMRTPAHAKAIMDGRVTYESDAMTIGTAVHQLLLRDDRVCVIEADSYRTKDAQAERERCRAAGLVPILRPKFDEAREIAQHVNGQILELQVEPTPFTKGTAEHVIRWDDNDATPCRALLDWVRDDRLFVDDLKTTGDASPDKFRRHIFNIRVAFRIGRTLRGNRLFTNQCSELALPDAANRPQTLIKGERRERESNPRIGVLQTPALPLGYPAENRGAEK